MRGLLRRICYNDYMKHLLKNKRFGRLVVLRESGKAKDRSILWDCSCDCGKVIKVKSRSLVSGETKSCGCLRKIKAGEANFNKLLANYQNSARRNDVPFSLMTEQFRELTKRNCHYCGTKPRQKKYRRFSNGAYIFNGIDRKNNDLGYTVKNSLPCCFICNRAKGTMSYKEFILWIQTIVKR